MYPTYEIAVARMQDMQREAHQGRLAAQARTSRLRRRRPRPHRRGAARPAHAP
ncbi:MAG: hypothetical protein ACRDYU_14135 [Actinomycetes bacterium]